MDINDIFIIRQAFKFYINMKANELYIRLYNTIMKNNDMGRSISRLMRDTIREIRNNLTELTKTEQNSVIFMIVRRAERAFTIERPDSRYAEDWSMFVCADRPEFIIMREETENHDEISVIVNFGIDNITIERTL